MTKINTNSSYKVSTVSSAFFPDKRLTIVTVVGTDGKNYIGRTTWNPSDPFDPQIGFKHAFERAIAKMPKPTIIEKCGGLRNGDWVCVKSSDYAGDISWGLVCGNFIYYMVNSNGFDHIRSFGEEGKTLFFEITKVIRGKDCIVTFDFIKTFIKFSHSMKIPNDVEIYTAD